jgi:hypothetical protein
VGQRRLVSAGFGVEKLEFCGGAGDIHDVFAFAWRWDRKQNKSAPDRSKAVRGVLVLSGEATTERAGEAGEAAGEANQFEP